MKSSPYITWAKERSELRYTLAQSGAPLCSEEELGIDLEDLTLHSPDEDGWLPLRDAVGARYGMQLDQVALAQSTTLANNLVGSLLLNPGDEVLVENPGYQPLASLCELLGARVGSFLRHPDDAYGLNMERLQKALTPATRLIILSNSHNPTGALADDSQLEALAALAESHDFHVLVDEIYLDLAPADRVRSAACISDRILATGGLTKSFGLPGLRMGWVLAEPDLVEGIRRINDLFTVLIAHPSERLALKALERAEAILAPRRALLEENRSTVDAFIAGRSELTWMPPAVGTVGWVRLEGATVEDLEEVLERDYESTVAPGRFFGYPEYFRVGFGMPETDLAEALNRLGSALDQLA